MSFNSRDVTQGGQVAFMRLRMFLQINNIVMYWIIISWGLITAAIMYLSMSTQNMVNGAIYWYCTTLEPMFKHMGKLPRFKLDYYGRVLDYDAAQVLSDAYTVYCGQQLKGTLINASLIALGMVLAGGVVFYWYLGRLGKQQSEDEITGGRVLSLKPKQVARMLRRRNKASHIVIDGLPMVKDTEVQNFAMHGTVGTGKSTLIRKFLDQCRANNDLVIIYDKGCTFVQEYYDESRDIILNPMDARCANWNLWEECRTLTDLEMVTNTLIPQAAQSADPFWQNSARTIFSEVAEAMRSDPKRNYTYLLRTLLSIELKKLQEYLVGTPAANLVDSSIEKTAIAIRSVLTNYAKSLRYLQGIDNGNKPSFTIRDWMVGNANRQQNGFLFVTSSQAHHDSIKPVISMWLQIAANSLLAMGPNPFRRVWFVYDELPTLHKLPTLPGIIAEARKFGGCFMLGFQSNAQLEEIYGDRFAKSMIDLLNTRFFFRSPSADIAQFVERELGQMVRRTFSEQTSFGADQVRDGISFGKDEERVSIVSYSDVQRLNDLECYITLPGDFPVVRHKLTYVPKAQCAPDLIERPIDTSLDGKIAQQEHRPARGLAATILLAANEPEPTVTNGPTEPTEPTGTEREVSAATGTEEDEAARKTRAAIVTLVDDAVNTVTQPREVKAPDSAQAEAEEGQADEQVPEHARSQPPSPASAPAHTPRKRAFARKGGAAHTGGDEGHDANSEEDEEEAGYQAPAPALPLGLTDDGDDASRTYLEYEQTMQHEPARERLRQEEVRFVPHHDLEP
ncbi:type IV conjugative transfer system coupling protein TraD [Aeromonas veronii]|uniref:type IV conjugative transfer system coupling protein TraD n=1 Tax=Aeromonas veronii TaxID=654 RepID=UPI0009470A61|nr:type IV conjugative transfer system coupling protein TraD [Aeromonas veronii]OLF56977.1 type IV conjugative transfer system coupling protein TraD [Aeromonas veronii]